MSKALIDGVLDPDSWHSWDEPLRHASSDPEYLAELDRARTQTGMDEAVTTGTGTIAGHRVAVIVSEFDFLAGSVGLAASQRILRAVHRATRERLPLLASPSSGGTRLQEGTAAFVEMTKIAAALAQHRAARLPYLVYLRHPTTGGVLASWGSLGQLTAAEPGALIGLLGPRVQRALYGTELPRGLQTAENLHTHGLIDAVVHPEDLRDVAARALTVLAAPQPSPGDESLSSESSGDESPRDETPSDEAPGDESFADANEESRGATDPWDSVVRSRRPERPGVRALLKIAATDVTPLSGTGAGERDEALVLALARFGKAACVVLGQDRRSQTAERAFGPAGLREAIRGIRLAADLHLPLVTVVDSPGAVPTAETEEKGLASGIAWCLSDLVTLPSPTACVLLGQGGGGTALALLPTDRVLCAEHAWLAPLPPEGAAEILHRSIDQAPAVVRHQGSDSAALLRDGIVDRVVAERPDAADEPEAFLRRLGRALEAELVALTNAPAQQRYDQRMVRYGAIG